MPSEVGTFIIGDWRRYTPRGKRIFFFVFCLVVVVVVVVAISWAAPAAYGGSQARD